MVVGRQVAGVGVVSRLLLRGGRRAWGFIRGVLPGALWTGWGGWAVMRRRKKGGVRQGEAWIGKHGGWLRTREGGSGVIQHELWDVGKGAWLGWDRGWDLGYGNGTDGQGMGSGVSGSNQAEYGHIDIGSLGFLLSPLVGVLFVG